MNITSKIEEVQNINLLNESLIDANACKLLLDNLFTQNNICGGGSSGYWESYNNGWCSSINAVTEG